MRKIISPFFLLLLVINGSVSHSLGKQKHVALELGGTGSQVADRALFGGFAPVISATGSPTASPTETPEPTATPEETPTPKDTPTPTSTPS
jgi:hypothetical protein